MHVAHLAELKNLRELRLWGTEITDDGVGWLRRALPGCKVEIR